MYFLHFLFNKDIFEFQIVIVCFETYFCVGLGFNGGWTTVCALAILLQTLIIVIMVALSASSVHEEVSLSWLEILTQSLEKSYPRLKDMFPHCIGA